MSFAEDLPDVAVTVDVEKESATAILLLNQALSTSNTSCGYMALCFFPCTCQVLYFLEVRMNIYTLPEANIVT